MLSFGKGELFILGDCLLMKEEVLVVLFGSEVLGLLEFGFEEEYLLVELLGDVDVFAVLRVDLGVEFYGLFVVFLCEFLVLFVQTGDGFIFELDLLFLFLEFFSRLSEFVVGFGEFY